MNLSQRILARLRGPANGVAITKGVSFTPANAWDAVNGTYLPGSKINYASEVQGGMKSSVVTSALCWMMSTFPEAPLVVQRLTEEKWENIPQHDMASLLRRPNREYGGLVLWQATIMDFCFGEAFWLKIRNGEGAVVELWWVPRALITPMADPDTGALGFYEYKPGNGPRLELSPDDVVHFRFGKDPSNILRGFSPLAAVMREVYTDDQAATFTAAILKNLGVIGVMFSPEEGIIPKEQAEVLKEYIKAAFTGDNRAKSMFFPGAMKATLLQYNLSGFDVGPIRDIAEERVCAALAIPAAVIGFGTGLQQTKVGATMREMIKLAWQGGIEPKQRAIADELDRSLLPEFQSNTNLFRTLFDTSQVEALTETPAEKTDRVMKLVTGNVIKVAQAQRELGYPVDSSQDAYARELTPAPATPAPADQPADNANDPPPVPAKSEQLPISLAVTIEAPRAGTKKQSGTMKKNAEGELEVTMTETTTETEPNAE